MINHCDIHITVIYISLFLVILIQYSPKHSEINHCYRHITHIRDTDTIQYVHFLLNKPAFSDHLSYVTLFQYFLEKSHKTVLIVVSNVQAVLITENY